MYTYRLPAPTGVAVDIFQGNSYAGEWEVSIWAQVGGMYLSTDGITTGASFSASANGTPVITFRLKDTPLYVLNTSGTTPYFNVVITPVVPTSVNLCISPCD